MVIKNKEIVALVAEQTQYFLENASQDKKIDVYKRIQKFQKAHKRSEVDD
jgi:hypothetical protein